jgi:phosphatidylserine decarboxylase
VDTTATTASYRWKIMAYADISNSDFIVKGYRFDILSTPNNAE